MSAPTSTAPAPARTPAPAGWQPRPGDQVIYIVEGQLFQVEKFDFDGRKAYVRSVECDYYTDAITYTKVTILDTFEARSAVSGAQSGNPDATDELLVHDGPRTAYSAQLSHGEVHVADLVHEAPNDGSLPMPSDHDWKRELRRRR